MVVYDVTDKQSFANCAKWLERVKAKKAAVDVPLPGKLDTPSIEHLWELPPPPPRRAGCKQNRPCGEKSCV